MTNENAENCVFYSNDSTPTESFSTELLDVITAALEDPDNHLDSIVKEALKRMDGTSITFAIPGTVSITGADILISVDREHILREEPYQVHDWNRWPYVLPPIKNELLPGDPFNFKWMIYLNDGRCVVDKFKEGRWQKWPSDKILFFKDFSPVPASAKALLDPETALGWSSVASCEPPEGVVCEVLLKNHLRGYCSTFKEGHWDFFNDSVVAFKAINLPYANYPEN